MIRPPLVAAFAIAFLSESWAAAPLPALAQLAPAEPVPVAVPLRHRDDAIGIRIAPAVPVARSTALERGALGVAAIDALARSLGGVRFEPEFPGEAGELGAYWTVRLPPGADARAAAGRFEALAEVEEAWPIAIVAPAAVPDDSMWSAAYYFHQPSRRDIHAPEAWDITTGDTSIVVAIVDTGVFPDHPDLAGQLWTNAAERAGTPGQDDDGNGYVDDTGGWDFIDLPSGSDVRPGEDGAGEDGDPNDFAGHGTAVAGIVGARTNNGIGVAGTAWKVRLMPLRIGWSSVEHPSGEGDVSYIARAIHYAARMGADVINVSFTTTNQPDLVATVNAALAAGVTIVAAAGNFAATHYLAQREDVISVTGTGPDDKVLGYVTVHPTVDLAAAGSRVATTTLDRDSLGNRWPMYTLASGSSFSAPLVSGAVALMQAERRGRGLPRLPPFDVRLRLTDTADDIAPINAGAGGFGTGRLNVFRALSDPPGSRQVTPSLRLTGPAVSVPRPPGGGVVAIAGTPAALMTIDPRTGATVGSRSLPSPPTGGVSAARLGTDRGIGLFVAAERHLCGFDLDLEPLPGWPVPIPLTQAGISRDIVLADLDGDDVIEVLWAGATGIEIYAVNGRRLRTIPVDPGGNAIAVADVDGQPGLEIVVSGSTTKVYRAEGSLLWTIPAGGEVPTAAIARLAPGEPPSVIVGYSTLAVATGGALRRRVTPEGTASQPPIVADLDGDGAAEIIQLRSHPTPLAVLGPALEPKPGWQSPVLTQNIDGPPVTGPVGAGGRVGILLSDPKLGFRAYDARGAELRTYPKPGLAGRKPFIGDIDGDGQTEVVAGGYASDDLMLYDSGPGSWNGGAGAWLTARANHGRTGSLTYAPPLHAPALPPPLATTDLAVVGVGADGIELRWTTPASPGGDPATRFEIRHSTSPFGAGDFFLAEAYRALPAPGAPGSVVTATITGLAESATHHLALRTRGSAGNWSAVSNVVVAAMPPIPPDPVTDLNVAARTDTTLDLRWTATGGDRSAGRPRAYLVRAGDAPFDSSGFDAAPLAWELSARADAGGTETARLRGVPLDRRLWFATIAVDSTGNRSGLSNLVEVTTTSAPPAAILDLAGHAELGTQVRLRWTATGEDDRTGTPADYLVHTAEWSLEEANFDAAPLRSVVPARLAAGGIEKMLFPNLARRRYWIAIKARDRAGNRSPISNVVTLRIDAPPAPITNLAIAGYTDTTVRLEWTAPAAHSGTEKPAFYHVRARVGDFAAIRDTNFDDVPYRWTVPATAGIGARERVDLRGLPPDAPYTFALAAFDSTGNRSPLSNLVSFAFGSLPPAPIGPLRLVARNDSSLTLEWTATGDDGRVGRPAAYRFRASRERVTDANFESAERRWDLASTVDAGLVERAILDGFLPNVRYFLAAIAVDRMGNRSLLTQNLEFTMSQTPPAIVEGLAIEARADTSLTLGWRATGEDGDVGRPREYLVRASLDSITWASFDACTLAWNVSATADAFGRERVVVEGLPHGRRHWFAVVASDRNANRSPVSASISVTPGPAPPAAARELRVAAEDPSGLVLEWVATGEDGDRGRPATYSVRAADHPLDPAGFESAPLRWEIDATVEAGEVERATLPGFTPARRHWVAIAAIDRFGNRGPISPAIEVTMSWFLPSPVLDLSVASQADSAVVLRWTATGEDGELGRPRAYRVRAARAPLDSATFDAGEHAADFEATVDAGREERVTLRGLAPHHRWWIALVAIDAQDNASAISNIASLWLGRLVGRDAGALELESQPARVPVRLLWRAPRGAASSRSIRIYDLAGRLQADLPLEGAEGGLATWDGRDRSGRPAPAAVYFARLDLAVGVFQTRIVLLR